MANSSSPNQNDECQLSSDFSSWLWLVADVTCFLALISMIYVAYRYYKIHTVFLEFENGVMDMLDEALQILIPLGVCKMISHPNTGAANPIGRQFSQELKTRQRENRYPEDVTWPHSNIELLYDMFGDDDIRMQRTLSLSLNGLEPLNNDQKVKKSAEVVDKAHPVEEVRTPLLKRAKIAIVESLNLTDYADMKTAEEKTTKGTRSVNTKSVKARSGNYKSLEVTQASKEKVVENAMY